MLISNESRDSQTADFCKEIINGGSFAGYLKSMPIEKSTFLLDMLEIVRIKDTNFRRLCKSEHITFPSFSKLAQYRNNIILENDLEYIHIASQTTIGIAISYSRIRHQSIYGFSKLFLL